MAFTSLARVPRLGIIAAVAAVLLFEGWRRMRKAAAAARRHTEDYGSLTSLVSYSSCLIAATRAVEAEQPDAYVRDVLAAALCGHKALAERRETYAAERQEPEARAAREAGRPRAIPRLVMRCRFFDDVVLTAVGGAASPESGACLGALAAACASSAACTQVVLLGSGMDTRPWRLALPAGVRWFEVDRADVLGAKQRMMRQADAGFDAWPAQMRHGANGAGDEADEAACANGGAASGGRTSVAGALEGGTTANGSHAEAADGANGASAANGTSGAHTNGASNGHHGSSDASSALAPAPPSHPLRAASWRTLSADLQRSGWSAKLLAAGLDVRQPVVWVLEGFLYYLEPHTVPLLLKEAASVSCKGSAMAASVLYSDPSIQQQQQQVRLRPQDPTPVPAAAPAAPSSSGGSAAAGSAPSTPRPTGGGPAPRADGAAPPASSIGTGGPRRGGGGVQAGRRPLVNEFKWRCQEPPDQFFGKCGWRVTGRPNWMEAAAAYGYPVTGKGPSSILFLTSVLDHV